LTTRTATFDGTLDYLFLSAGHWQVLSTLDMPFPSQQQQGQGQHGQRPGGGGLTGAHAVPPGSVSQAAFPPAPNAVWASDHVAVGAELELLGGEA
jgi:hypothetical protein